MISDEEVERRLKLVVEPEKSAKQRRLESGGYERGTFPSANQFVRVTVQATIIGVSSAGAKVGDVVQFPDAPPLVVTKVEPVVRARKAAPLADRYPWTCLAVLLLLALSILAASSEEMPAWVLPGLIARETSSYVQQDGRIRYVVQSRGSAGEVGITQALPATLRQHGASPSLFEQDVSYAMRVTAQILAHYRAKAGSWESAVAAWRKGLGGRTRKTAVEYAESVRALGESALGK